ncbi:MAG TPA: hemerythrin domain-containing protein [Gammaproteobacteria bacterium]|nr:hemerythrin domain-containing protein [Gammaproteobacteria bacterium]
MPHPPVSSRRSFLRGAGTAGLAVGLGGLGASASMAFAATGGDEIPVTATEDLMREHGVLRRVLLVYLLAAQRLRRGEQVSPNALRMAAQLFHVFGESYHERAIEERYVFPEARKLGGKVADYVDTLLVQHQRGRQITSAIMQAAQRNKIGRGESDQLANTLDSMVLMYQEHTAREDTVVFVAWKRMLSARAYRARGEKFEEIEKKMFGHDGFDVAVNKIYGIEQELGMAKLAQFTAPLPVTP